MDAEISNLLGESMEHFQTETESQRKVSASLQDCLLSEKSPQFGEGKEHEFQLSSGTAEKDDIPLGLDSPSVGRTASSTKSVDLAALGILTEDSDLALANDADHDGLLTLDHDTGQSRLFERTSPDLFGLLGGSGE